MFSDQFLIELPTEDRPNPTTTIAPLATYVATKSAALLSSYNTAIDADERTDLIVSLSSYALSASLLSLAYMNEDESLIDQIKTIIRKTERLPYGHHTLSETT